MRYGRTRKTAAIGRSALRIVRRRLREPAPTQDDIASLPDGRLVDAAEALIDAERGRAIGRALGKLPPGDLKLLELRFQDDLPAREIAEALEMPTPFHVYRRLRSVCGALRADLEEAGVGQGGRR
jgi:DNA-directed RNA polymerase specialized sigma24 family protein